MVKFIHISVLDRTVVTADNIYAPSDDGAFDVPEDLAAVIGKQESKPVVQEEKPESQATPTKGG